MTSHTIVSWNAVIPPNFTQARPMLYIKPDNPEEFLAQAKKSDYIILVSISGTGASIYEGKKILATVNTSGQYPEYRPNFFNKTGYLTLLLEAPWYGYPPKNGKISIEMINNEKQGLKQVQEHFEEKEPKNNHDSPVVAPTENYSKNEPFQKTKKSLSTSQIGYMLLAILVVFLVLVYISSQN